MSSSSPSELESRPQSRREWSGVVTSLVLPLAVVTALVAALLFLRANNSSSDGEAGSVSLPAEKNPTGLPPLAAEGRAAPDFALLNLNDKALRLSDQQGTPVAVIFWASWCANCRAALPSLVAGHSEHGAELTILAVNLGETLGQNRSTVETFGIEFPVLRDTNGEVARTWNVAADPESLPTAFFIDEEGVIVARVTGPLGAEAFEESVALILRGAD